MDDHEKRVAAIRLLKRAIALLEEPVVYTSTWTASVSGPDIVHFWSVPRKGWLARRFRVKDHYGYTKDGKKYQLTPNGWTICSPSS